jgi:hypothetical protein
VVALETAYRGTRRFTLRQQTPIDILQRFPAVNLRLASPQQIQIGPVQYQDYLWVLFSADLGLEVYRDGCLFPHSREFAAYSSELSSFSQELNDIESPTQYAGSGEKQKGRLFPGASLFADSGAERQYCYAH